MKDKQTLKGHGTAVLRGPDGKVKQTSTFDNVVTQTGARMYTQNGGGVTSPANTPTGMRLGTNNATPAATGSGAAIGTYISGSNKAFDATPTEATQGVGSRVTYVATWAAGEATANGIVEAVITNETPLTDVAGNTGNTVSRALLSPIVNKTAADTLEITWNHDLSDS